MRPRLTLRQALQQTYDLWTWLADNPHAKGKKEWPDWNARGLYPDMPGGDRYVSDCPCCEYSRIEGCLSIECARCPLREFWPDGCEPEDPDNTTAWVRWYEANDDSTREQAAQEIANAAKAELDKLPKGDK
jgi:hypothetical protein